MSVPLTGMCLQQKTLPGRARELLLYWNIDVKPSDTQRMLLEMLPEAMWEIARIDEWYDVEYAKHNVAIVTRVTVLNVVSDGTDVYLDILNKERTQKELRNDPCTPTNQVTHPRRA